MKSNVDYRVRSLYYILLGKDATRKDLKSAIYIKSLLDGAAKIRGSVLVDINNKRYTSIKDVVQMIVQDMKEEKSNEVG